MTTDNEGFLTQDGNTIPGVEPEQPSPGLDEELSDEDDLEPEGEDSEEQPSPDEDEEIDVDGDKYMVPKKLKEAFLRQMDYTIKTQELAEQRRVFEEQQTTLSQNSKLQAEFLDSVADIRALDRQLQEFAQVDWNALSSTDPQRTLQLQIQYNQLRDARHAKAVELDGKVSQQAQMQERQAAAATAKTIEALKTADPKSGWPGYSVAHMTKLANAAMELGMTKQDIMRMTTPHEIKRLNLMVLGQQSLKSARKLTATPQAKPVSQVRGNRANGTSNPDTMPIEQWVKQERKRMAARNAQ